VPIRKVDDVSVAAVVITQHDSGIRSHYRQIEKAVLAIAPSRTGFVENAMLHHQDK
jgi:hypothetical protein